MSRCDAITVNQTEIDLFRADSAGGTDGLNVSKVSVRNRAGLGGVVGVRSVSLGHPAGKYWSLGIGETVVLEMGGFNNPGIARVSAISSILGSTVDVAVTGG